MTHSSNNRRSWFSRRGDRLGMLLWIIVAVLLSSAAVLHLRADSTIPASVTPVSHERPRATKSIEDIRPGDIVLSRNNRTGGLTYKRVIDSFQRDSDHLRILQLRASTGETIQELRTTDEHPFFEQRSGWTGAGKLRVGDQILQSDGATATVVATRREEHPDGHPVYNFTVVEHHTYYVSANGSRAPPVLVHNMGVCEGKGNFDAARREAFQKAGMSDSSNVKFTKVDPATGTVVEFKGPGGAKVGYDAPHLQTPGQHHDVPHVSWQSAGKRSGGGTRGNIPYSGPQHPYRQGDIGTVEPH